MVFNLDKDRGPIIDLMHSINDDVYEYYNWETAYKSDIDAVIGYRYYHFEDLHEFLILHLMDKLEEIPESD